MKGSKQQDCVAILISKKVDIKQNITVEIGKDPKHASKEKKITQKILQLLPSGHQT